MDLAHLVRNTFNTYVIALRDEVMRNPGGRYSRVRQEEINALFRSPKPQPEVAPVTPPTKYQHMVGRIEDFNLLCDLATPLPDTVTVLLVDPDKESSTMQASRGAAMEPLERFARPSDLKEGDIVEINCVGRWPGETRPSRIRLTLYPFYRPVRVIARRGQYDEAELV